MQISVISKETVYTVRTRIGLTLRDQAFFIRAPLLTVG
jgi:hypothetical protein